MALEILVLINAGTADSQVPVSDAKSLYAAHPESGLLVIDDRNHVLKVVSDEEEHKASYSNPDLPLAVGLMEGIIKFLKQFTRKKLRISSQLILCKI